MHRRYPLLTLLSLLVVGLTAWNCTTVLRYAGLPFSFARVSPHVARIARLHKVALPPNLQPGDRVDYARQPSSARMDLFAVAELATVRAGHSVQLVVTHPDGSHSRVRVASRPLAAEPSFRVSIYLGFAWYLLACLITLMALWRGRDRAAWGIAMWAIAFLAGMALYQAPVSDLLVLGCGLGAQICFLLARVGFFFMAAAVAAPALTPRNRRALRYAFIFSLVIGYAYELSYSLYFVYGAVLIPQIAAAIWVLPYAIATFTLLAAHHGAVAETRPRLRWMFWSGVILTFGILLSNVPLFGYEASYLVEIIAYVIAFSGLLYSVLRHRVVDMSFVVNRAIVYSATLGVITVIFILLESFAEKFALGHSESLALELGVPLIIGFSFEAIRKRLESLGERVFFRHKFENDQALRAFARQCAYIEDPDHLRAETLRELRLHTDTPATAFYWHENMQVYRRLARAGADDYPEALDGDDRAIVAMRAERETVNLHELASALGEGGIALPMLVRGELLGLIALGNRPGEDFPSDERELLGYLVHEVGAAMLALRARANARFVSAIAEGTLSETEVRAQARVLMPPPN
ncbi:MAG: hypothetical protein ACRESR_00880 [Gammaproteobacteria bacterium]